MDRFQTAYAEWMEQHEKNRIGESLRRLKEGHAHAEKLFLTHIWWPVVKNFSNLYPEYEYKDFEDRIRYLDFAFIVPPFRIAIEIDGYCPHWRNVSRSQFADNLMRQNFLILDGWIVLRFSYDDINERPRRCQRVLLELMGIVYRESLKEHSLKPFEKEILQLAMNASNHMITMGDVISHLAISDGTARKHLRNMLQNGWLIPAKPGTKRIHAYRINPNQIKFNISKI